MFTTLENVHNARKCSQRLEMLTTGENAHQSLKITIYQTQTTLDLATIFEIAYKIGHTTLPTDALTSLPNAHNSA